MNSDIKFGAVFSLTDDESTTASSKRNRSDPLEIKIETEPLEDLNEEVDILSTREDDVFESISEKLTASSTTNLITCAKHAPGWQNALAECNSSLTSPSLDSDIPPPLQRENYIFTPITELDSSSEITQPPILQSVKSLSSIHGSDTNPNVDRWTPAKEDHFRKIHPCYIVLTNVNPFIDPVSSSTSYQSFKRMFTECSNMCKKTFFKRRLKAGKDVFNVKASNKQKDYLLYLEKAERARKKAKRPRHKILPVPMLAELLKHNDFRNKSFGRVRRTVSYVPKDFKQMKTVRSLSPADGEKLSKEQDGKRFETIRTHTHRRELESLRKLIMIKRNSNRNLKRLRKSPIDAAISFLKSDMKSTVSGRIRKTNTRYSEDFAFTKIDIDKQIELTHLQVRLKKAETENKKRIEKEMKEREKAVETDTNITQSKNVNVVIDNAECHRIKKFPNSRQISRNSKKFRKMIKKDVKKQTLKYSDILKARKRKGTNDVIIQDLHKNEQLVSGFLQNVLRENKTANSPILDKKLCRKWETDIEQGNQYAFAKSVLSQSLDSNRLFAEGSCYTTNTQSSSYMLDAKPAECSSVTLNEDKLKKFKIPENVQNLFKIKTEPKTENPITTNIAYHADSPSKIQHKSIETTTPFIVATQGMRRLVPKSPTPSCSETMNAKFNSSTPTITSKNFPTTRFVIVKSSQGENPKLPTKSRQSVQYTLTQTNSSTRTSTSSSILAPKIPVNVPESIGKLVTAGERTQGGVQMPSPFAEVKKIVTLSSPNCSFSKNVASVLAISQPTSILANTNSVSSRPGSLMSQSSSVDSQLPNSVVSKVGNVPIQLMVTSSNATITSTETNISQSCVQNISRPTAETASVSGLQTLQQDQSWSANSVNSPLETCREKAIVKRCKFILTKVDGNNILVQSDPTRSKTCAITNQPVPMDTSQPCLNDMAQGAKSATDCMLHPVMDQVCRDKIIVNNPAVNKVHVPIKPRVAIIPKVHIHKQLSGACTPVTIVKPVSASNNYELVSIPRAACSPTVSIQKQAPLKSAVRLVKMKTPFPRPFVPATFPKPQFKIVQTVNVNKNASHVLNSVNNNGDNTGTVVDLDASIVERKEEDYKGKSTYHSSTLESTLECDKNVFVKQKTFAEVVSEREERLRKLKELLKEKQRAVDEIKLRKRTDS